MRPRCKKVCCSSDEYVVDLYDLRLSTKEIGEMCGTSDVHIAMRLNSLGVRMRSRRDYSYERSNKGGRKRRSKLWGISEEDLFETPMEVLMERYGASVSQVSKVRRLRKSERAGKEAVS